MSSKRISQHKVAFENLAQNCQQEIFVFCLNEYSNTTLMVNFGFSLQTDDPADFFARISSFGFYFLSSANVPKLMTNESLKK